MIHVNGCENSKAVYADGDNNYDYFFLKRKEFKKANGRLSVTHSLLAVVVQLFVTKNHTARVQSCENCRKDIFLKAI